MGDWWATVTVGQVGYTEFVFPAEQVLGSSCGTVAGQSVAASLILFLPGFQSGQGLLPDFETAVHGFE